VVPVNVWSAVFFLVLVAPGLLYDLLVETRISRTKESAFREIGRVVLASLAFSALPLLLLTIVGDLGWIVLLPDPSEWAASGASYAVNNYAPIVVSLVLQCFSSCLLVAGFYWFKYKGRPKLNPTPVWRKVFRDDNPSMVAPVARVKTLSGRTYEGVLAAYTQGFEQDRDLVLSPPLKIKPPGLPMTDLPVGWQRVIIPSSSVDTITVRYQSRQPTPTSLAKPIPRA
jgi:hypothetical protein